MKTTAKLLTRTARTITLVVAAMMGGAGWITQPATAAEQDKADLSKTAVDHRDDRGWTLLMIAANQGRGEVVKALLEKGADPNATEPARGATATFMAAFQGHDEIIRLLAARGANLNAKSPVDGVSAIILACKAKKWATVKTLVELGADPAIADGKGLTSLLYAAGDGNTELVGFLESKGASVKGSLETYEAAKKARRAAPAAK